MSALGGRVPGSSSFESDYIRILERVACGAPLAEVLQRIVLAIEARGSWLCTILLLDQETQTMHHAAAPSLPASYVQGLDGTPIGPEEGSCGTAAYRKERVVVSDIATHPYWRNYRALAASAGLAACWSTPILSPNNDVLGTFAMYCRELREPVQADLDLVDAATHLASIALARDLAEARLNKQADLLDRAHDAIVVRGLDETVQFWNEGAVRLYGWTRAEAVGHKITQLLYRENAAPFRDAQLRLLAHGEWSGELVQLTKSGQEVVVEARWTLLCDKRGRPESVLVINTNVTEKKQLEAQVRLAQRMESLGVLSGGVAHEFNNILAAIIGYVELARQELPAEHAVNERLEVVLNAADRATDLVAQLLAVSRRSDVRRLAIALPPVVDEALRLLKATVPAMIRIRTEVAPGMLTVAASASQVHQVVLNLAMNAVHAMDGRGTLTFALEPVEVRATIVGVSGEATAGRYVRLSVSDDGCGMDEETLARIFEPFFTTKGPGLGTGLGLPVVLGILQEHRAVLVVSSKVGEGTTFAIYFPASTPSAEAACADAPVPSPRGDGRRILCVDDERAIVAIETQVLQGLGYSVEGHTDPVEALRAFAAAPTKFDAVVTDYAMRGMSGMELAREILQLRPDVPVLMTSGYLRPEDAERARRLGIRKLLVKPDFIGPMVNGLGALLADRASAESRIA